MRIRNGLQSILAAFGVLLTASTARAQVTLYQYNVSLPTCTDGKPCAAQVDVNGRVITVGPTGSSATQVQGAAAHDATVVGNPVLIGGYSSAAAPTDVSADGEAVRMWLLRNGAVAMTITAAGALIAGDATNGLDTDVTRFPDNEPFNIAQYGGTAVGAANAVHVQPGTNATWTSVGAAADGAAVSGNPVRIAGKDGSGNTQDIATDTSGRPEVVGVGTAGSAAGGVVSVQGVASMTPVATTPAQATASSLNAEVQGDAADGASVSGNPVLMGCQDGTLAQSVLCDSTGRPVVVGAGTAGSAAGGVFSVQGVASMTPIATTPAQATASSLNAEVQGDAADGAALSGNPVLTGCSDGTLAQSIACNSSGQPVIVGAGTAGSPAGGVVSMQGVASGQPMIVSQSTASNLNAEVQGDAADGAAVSGNPVRIAGKDGSGNTQDILTDSSGNMLVGDGSGAFNVIVDSGAITAAQGTGAAANAAWSARVSNGTDFNAANAPLFTQLSDGSAGYTGAKTGQLPSALGQAAAGSSLSIVPYSSPGPTVYMPARLTDGTDFWNAQGQTGAAAFAVGPTQNGTLQNSAARASNAGTAQCWTVAGTSGKRNHVQKIVSVCSAGTHTNTKIYDGNTDAAGETDSTCSGGTVIWANTTSVGTTSITFDFNPPISITTANKLGIESAGCSSSGVMTLYLIASTF